MNLFTMQKDNTKLAKGKESDYFTISLFMAPWKDNSYKVNLCPFASPECIRLCLSTSGRAGIFPKIREARQRKADLFLSDRTTFIELLRKEIRRYRKKALRLGKTLAVRLNGTTDIDYPNDLFQGEFSDCIFYDYTKSIYRIRRKAQGLLPSNYHLTFSYSGDNLEECREALSYGVNVATVFSHENFPSNWLGFPIKSGEENDLRFLDPTGYVIGLKAKGKARKQDSDFVIQIDRPKNG